MYHVNWFITPKHVANIRNHLKTMLLGALFHSRMNKCSYKCTYNAYYKHSLKEIYNHTENKFW